jgi:hypothetical protein
VSSVAPSPSGNNNNNNNNTNNNNNNNNNNNKGASAFARRRRPSSVVSVVSFARAASVHLLMGCGDRFCLLFRTVLWHGVDAVTVLYQACCQGSHGAPSASGPGFSGRCRSLPAGLAVPPTPAQQLQRPQKEMPQLSPCLSRSLRCAGDAAVELLATLAAETSCISACKTGMPQ